MATPSHNPGRSDGPNDDFSRESLSPSHRRSLLELGRLNLVQHFEAGLPRSGLTRLSMREEQQWRERYVKQLEMHLLSSLKEQAPATQPSVILRVLGVAKNTDAYYAVVGLEGTDQFSAYCVGTQNTLVELAPGSHAGWLVRVPISIAPKQLPTLLSHDNYSVSPLSESFFMSPRSISFEARRFAAGNLSGLFGDIFTSEVKTLTDTAPKSWDIVLGFASDQDRSRYAFSCFSKEVGQLLFEVGIDEETGELCQSLSRPTRKSAAKTDAALSAAQPLERRTTLAQNLERLGYRQIPLLPAEGGSTTPEPFIRDLRDMWKAWSPGNRWSIHLAGFYAKPKEPVDSFLLETYLVDARGNYLVPFFRGSQTIVSKKPIHILCEARANSQADSSVSYRCLPRMIQLPPEYPVEPLLTESLQSFPESLVGFYSLVAIRRELENREVKWLGGDSHGYVVSPEESTSTLPPASPSASSPELARILCYHSRGAHVLTVHAGSGGLIDLQTGIHPEHFFPEHIPFPADR